MIKNLTLIIKIKLAYMARNMFIQDTNYEDFDLHHSNLQKLWYICIQKGIKLQSEIIDHMKG